MDFGIQGVQMTLLIPFDMTGYRKLAPLTPWWEKMELKDLSISHSFEELRNWSLEYKKITPKHFWPLHW